MTLDRRFFLTASLAVAFALPVSAGCSAGPNSGERGGSVLKTKLYVLGVIHSNHRTSERYSLRVLEAAIRKAAPDVILAEIPPDRIEQATSSFRETGKVDEPRTQVFPEYTDVVFPLSNEIPFEIEGTAGWTSDIARNRSAALRRIQNDPARAQQWAEHRAARRAFSRDLAGRGDDPRFIHTREYDRLVEAAYSPYQRFFDDDLGKGGWTQINAAHTGLINQELDAISGQGLTAVITFGTAHKYKILESVSARGDIELLDAATLFL